MTTLSAPSRNAVDHILEKAPDFTRFRTLSADKRQQLLSDFIAVIYATDFVASFDWMTEFPTDDPRWDDINLLKKADAAQVRELLIAHLRLDRFSHGHLERVMTSGFLGAALSRLRALFAATP
ncbi:DUF6508 domain-containing protein [Pseudomonas sp. LP_7_YM]|uniref:DUF6508 domain-containing protein n=1 Tax=Pseudomonas sp. LP_7_YM TaxID=2485137 RepID=UPI00105E6050|nr:DUF6508 domain-containing protein [Pseudomonas sp. LP_7_YM]TDV59687.1 hypothetical protein EC915_11520 [Pseudomonas sp. LP_7_YM]